MIDIDNEFLLFAGQDNVPEIFYTLEGEGEYIGQPSVFFRFFGCNLTCKGFASADSPHGCDSYVSWSIKNKLSFRETFDIIEREKFVDKLREGAIMKLTGGEPLARQNQLLKFVQAFAERYEFVPRIDFETNATLMPDEEWINRWDATFTTSPKLTSNGDPEDKTYKPEVLKWHVDHFSGFKFVINTSEDLDEIWRKYVNDKNGINCPLNRIWFMPCCGSRTEHIEKAPAVAEYAKALNVNFSPRLHLLLWDKALRV
jgi:7-carboxy-7-deazaguanine synthase